MRRDKGISMALRSSPDPRWGLNMEETPRLRSVNFIKKAYFHICLKISNLQNEFLKSATLVRSDSLRPRMIVQAEKSEPIHIGCYAIICCSSAA
jgi:hypothetical protein